MTDGRAALPGRADGRGAPGGVARIETPDAPAEARALGRGFLFILFAKAYFLVTGFAVQFGLPRLFQRAAAALPAVGRYAGMNPSRIAEALYGDCGAAVKTVSWLNNTVVQGTIQAVSKFVAEDEARALAVRSAALRVQGFLGASLALLYFLLAGVVARLLADANLAGYFRITAVIILAYSLYAVFIGYLNGLRQFHAQAGFDVAYSTLKTFLMLGAAGLGFGVAEVLLGFSSASVLILVAAALLVGLRPPRHRTDPAARFPWQPLMRAIALVVGYYIVFNLLMTCDLWLVKALAGRVPGVPAGRAAALASAITGVYSGVQAVAFVPYQAVLAVAFVAFPVVSRSTFTEDHGATRTYVRNTLRYSLLFAGLIATPLMARPAGLLALVKPSFAVAAPALGVYAAGEVAFALFAIANTVLIASGRMLTATLLALTTLAVDVAANLLTVPRFIQLVPAPDGGVAVDPGALVAAATATTAAFLVGLVASLAVLGRVFGARPPLATAARVSLAATVAVLFVGRGLGRFLPAGAMGTLLGAAVAAALYLGVLAAAREMDPEDRRRLASILGRKRASP